MNCPQCKSRLVEPTSTCPKCRADLSLLADLFSEVAKRFDAAENHRKSGELAAAVRAYCDVLDLDPTQERAREALGDVLLALRIIGKMTPRRKWLPHFIWLAVLVIAVAAAGILGYWFGIATTAASA